LFLVCGCFLRQVLGMCSIRIFAKKHAYYEPTIVVHDNHGEIIQTISAMQRKPSHATTKSTLFIVSKDEWDTEEDTG